MEKRVFDHFLESSSSSQGRRLFVFVAMAGGGKKMRHVTDERTDLELHMPLPRLQC